MRLAVAVLAALSLAGCESTAEKSEQLERVAKRSHSVAEAKTPLRALAAGPAGTKVHVQATALLHTSEGTAAVVTVRNLTSSTLHRVPILLEVKDAAGAVLYTNNQPGISSTLTSIPSIPAGGSLDWVDDQIQASGRPVSVSAKLGEGETGGGSASLPVSGHANEQNANGGTVEGTVTNSSVVAGQEVVVYATARRGGRIASAGRAVLSEVPARGSSHFQLFLIGDPSGASLQLSAAATS